MSDSKTKCPYCGKNSQWEDNSFRPFCSERCKMIDLGKWANEEYTIPDRDNKISDEDLNNLNSFDRKNKTIH